MNAEFLQIAKVVEMEATGNPGAIQTITLESGTPYRHLCMYLQGSAIAVTAQPLFGGAADGAATNVAGDIASKIFQVALEEVRPATRGSGFDGTGLVPLKSQLRLTNTDTNPAKLSVFILASASTGGA